MKFKPLKDTRQEAVLFVRRALVGFAIILVALAALALRFWYLQVDRHDEFQARSDSNRILTRPLAPARGLIYDRNGVLLAENVAAFRLEIIPEQVPDMDALLDDLIATIGVNDDDIVRFKALRKGKRSYESLPLRLKLSEEEIARFAVNRWRFPGVDVVPYLTRYSPKGKEFGHLVGYVGRIDARDLERLDASRYAGTTHAGKTGIERSYEELLHGEPGYELVEVNADRRPLRVLDRVAPKPGKNIYLTVDVRIQEAGEDAFAERAGASARRLNAAPRLILADDPTKGIDVQARGDLHKIFCEMAARGAAVVMVSSDDEELVSLAEKAGNARIVVMYEGGVAATLRGEMITSENIAAASMPGGG